MFACHADAVDPQTWHCWLEFFHLFYSYIWGPCKYGLDGPIGLVANHSTSFAVKADFHSKAVEVIYIHNLPCVQLLCVERNAACQRDLAIDKAEPPASATKWQGNDQTDLQCQAARHCRQQVKWATCAAWHWGSCLFVLRFYGPVNPMGSCRARSVYLTTRLLGRLSPLSG